MERGTPDPDGHAAEGVRDAAEWWASHWALQALHDAWHRESFFHHNGHRDAGTAERPTAVDGAGVASNGRTAPLPSTEDCPVPRPPRA
jgi:hypothetical protein